MFLPLLTEHAQALTPDAAVGVGTLGICLGFLEFNRPGRILPGAIGLLLLLFACAALSHRSIYPGAVLLLTLSIALLLANLWRKLPLWALGIATVGLAAGLRFLIATPAAANVHTPVAVFCGAVLGVLSGALTRIAYRARRSKALD